MDLKCEAVEHLGTTTGENLWTSHRRKYTDASKHVNTCPVSFVTSKTQMSSTTRHHSKPTGIAKAKNNDAVTRCQGSEEMRPLGCADGVRHGTVPLETCLTGPHRAQRAPATRHRGGFPGLLPQGNETRVHLKSLHGTSPAAVSVTAERWQQHGCFSAGDGADGLCCGDTAEYP